MAKTSKTLKKKPLDRNVYDLAVERMENIFDRFDTVAVSFSGGKDSTACLQIAYDVAKKKNRLPLIVIHWDEEAIPYQTEEYVRRVSQWDGIEMRWYCIPLKHRNACSRKSPFWYCWDPRIPEKWVRPIPPEAITHLPGFELGLQHHELTGILFPPEKYGTVGYVMGIRAQESITRYRAVANRKEDNYIIPYEGPSKELNYGNVYKCYPIYDWQTEDVWTAPKKFGWDYNRAYDVMDKAGISLHAQRLSAPFGEEPIGGLHLFKTCFPEIWDKTSMRVPGANTAMMYARTELYSFGKKPQPLEGMTWEETIRHYIQKFDAEGQVKVAERIQQEIKMHYNKTKDPILPHANHPETGVSWEFLLMLAMRGDFKHRRRPTMKIAAKGSKKHAQMKKKYQEELERLRREGKI
jgi:predicted phosphoadenosine phosphosulfate sulfurtransferase